MRWRLQLLDEDTDGWLPAFATAYTLATNTLEAAMADEDGTLVDYYSLTTL